MTESFDHEIGGVGRNLDWLMEFDCGGYNWARDAVLGPLPEEELDFHHTGGLVQPAVIAKEVFSRRLEVAADKGEDFVTELSLADVAEAQRALAEAMGCGTMARSDSDVCGPGEFSGTRGIKGRPLEMGVQPMDSEHANLERHHAAFATNPADPTSGEAEGDTIRSV